MANRRFSANTHYKNDDLYDRDIIPFTHNNAGDGKIGVGQLQCLPIAKCTSSSGTVNKTATMQNLGQFSLEGISAEKLVGRRIGVIFTNENTATNPTLNIASTSAYPITTHGVPVGNKSIKAGNYTVTLYPYGNSYCWDIDNGGVVSVSGSTVTYYDGSVVPLNSALSEQTITSNNVQFSKVGKRVIANCKGWFDITNIIPEGYRPNANIFVSASSNSGEHITLTIKNTGEVIIFQGSTTQDRVLFSAIWITS